MVQAAGRITVQLSDGRTAAATVVGTDPTTDLAVGITTANASVDGQSAGSIGVGFAIPSNRVKQVVNRLTGASRPSRPARRPAERPAPSKLPACSLPGLRLVADAGLRARPGGSVTDAMTTTVLPRTVPPVPIATPADDGRARLDAAVRLGAGAGLWLSLLLVAWWWAAGGGLRDLDGWQAGLTSLGRLTGLVASDLLLVQVLLMARVPPLERAFGQDELVRRHRLVGFTSFNLMVAHIVLITWGYAAGQLARTPATLWDLVTDHPGMLLALAGTACPVLLVATSVRAARARLRYESWHLLHPYAYLGVGLTGRHLDRLPAEAGQFLTWRFPGRPGWTRASPYSLSAAPDGRGLRVTVKELGDNSAAPLRALAEGLDHAPGEAVLLHRFTDRPLFERELHRLVRDRGLHVLWLPGHRRAPGSWLGDGTGPADDLTAMRWWVPDLAERDVYVCGPEEWADTVRRLAVAAGVPPEQLHVEKFRW